MILAPDALAETALLAVSAMQRQALTRKVNTMYAFAPDGTPITGTLERLDAEAYITPGSFARAEDGSIFYDHAGDTEIWWDDQETVTQDGKILYLDTCDRRWTEDQLVFSEAEDWSPEETTETAPTDPGAALQRIASRLRGEWRGSAGDLSSDLAEVVRSVPGFENAFPAAPET